MFRRLSLITNHSYQFIEKNILKFNPNTTFCKTLKFQTLKTHMINSNSLIYIQLCLSKEFSFPNQQISTQCTSNNECQSKTHLKSSCQKSISKRWILLKAKVSQHSFLLEKNENSTWSFTINILLKRVCAFLLLEFVERLTIYFRKGIDWIEAIWILLEKFILQIQLLISIGFKE